MCQLAKRLFFICSPNDVKNKPENIRLQIQSTDKANKRRENNVKMDRIKTSRQRHNAYRINEIYNQLNDKRRFLGISTRSGPEAAFKFMD